MLWPTSRQELLIRIFRFVVLTAIIWFFLPGVDMGPIERFNFPTPIRLVTPQQMIGMVDSDRVSAMRIDGGLYRARLKDNHSIRTTLLGSNTSSAATLADSCADHMVNTLTMKSDSSFIVQQSIVGHSHVNELVLVASPLIALFLDLLLKYRKVRNVSK